MVSLALREAGKADKLAAHLYRSDVNTGPRASDATSSADRPLGSTKLRKNTFLASASSYRRAKSMMSKQPLPCLDFDPVHLSVTKAEEGYALSLAEEIMLRESGIRVQHVKLLLELMAGW